MRGPDRERIVGVGASICAIVALIGAAMMIFSSWWGLPLMVIGLVGLVALTGKDLPPPPS